MYLSMSHAISSQPSRMEQLKAAFKEAGRQAEAKPWSQRIKEQVSSPYYFAKGVGKWALSFLESGQGARPESMLLKYYVNTAVQAHDLKNAIQGKDSQIASDLKVAADKVSNPGRELKSLWKGGLDKATESTKNFILLSPQQQAEKMGELAPEAAMCLGAGGKLKSVIGKSRLKGAGRLSVNRLNFKKVSKISLDNLDSLRGLSGLR